MWVAMLAVAVEGSARADTTPVASLEKAQRALQAGNATQAAKLLEILKRRYPHDARVWRALGSAQRMAQHPAQAIVAFEHALSLEPDSPQVFYGLGVAHASLRQKPASLLWLRRARESRRYDMTQMTADADLRGYLSDPDFSALL